MKKFGIIAGAGAMAGAYTYKAILDYFLKKGVSKDSDFPYLKIINYPFKSTDSKGISSSTILHEEMQILMQDVEDCDYVFILCNSIHSFISKSMSQSQASKLIALPNMIGASPDYDKTLKTLVVCSESSKNYHLFDFLGKNIHYLDNESQTTMNEYLQDTIEGKINNNLEKKLSDMVLTEGFEQIILGCTDLYANSSPFEFENCKTINPLQYLCEFIFEHNKSKNTEKQETGIFDKIFPPYLFSYNKELG